MDNAQWGLEAVVVVLLIATLVHAIRLERALGVLRRDRSALEALISGFNDSTRQAEGGIERLRATSEGTGRQIARHIEQARSLKDDLVFLADRAEQAADRMERLLRNGRASEALPSAAAHTQPALQGPLKPDGGRDRARSEAELELLRALKLAR